MSEAQLLAQMRSSISERTPGPALGRLSVFLPAALSIGLLLLCVLAAGWVVTRRIAWNFETEWVEGQIAMSCLRVVNGLPLYPPPSIEYVGDNYPPLYFWVCGLLIRLVGQPMLVCRCVSVLSTLAIAVAIALIPRKGPLSIRIFFAGCFLAYFSAAYEWYDLARVDMFAVALGAWGCYAAMRGRSTSSCVLAAVCLGLAAITKHSLIVMAGAMPLAVMLRNTRRGLVMGAVALGIPAVTFGLLHATTNGWSTHYLFVQPSTHEFFAKKLIQFWESDIGPHGMILFIGLGLWTGMMLVRRRTLRASRRAFAPAVLALGGIAATLPGRIKSGGSANNLIPMWTFLLMAGAWTMPAFLAACDRLRKNRRIERAAFWFCMVGVSVSLFGTFGRMWENREQYADPAGRLRDIERFHHRIETLSKLGPVWVVRHPLYSRVDPMKTIAHGSPILFLQNTAAKPARNLFYESLREYLAGANRPAVVVFNHPHNADLAHAVLDAGYVDAGFLIGKNHNCKPLTAYKTYPDRIFVRKDLAKLAPRR